MSTAEKLGRWVFESTTRVCDFLADMGAGFDAAEDERQARDEARQPPTCDHKWVLLHTISLTGTTRECIGNIVPHEWCSECGAVRHDWLGTLEPGTAEARKVREGQER